MSSYRSGIRDEGWGWPERFRELFPNALKEARKRANLSQGEVAGRLQLRGFRASGKSAVSDWERGRALPKLATFLALCEVLEQPPAYFMQPFFTDTPKPKLEDQVADKVFARIRELLKPGGNGAGDVSAGWVDEFLRELNMGEAIAAAAEAMRESALGDPRYVREAAAEVEPHLEAITRHVARNVLEQFVQWRRHKREA